MEADAREPSTVDEVINEEPILQRLRERISRRAREAAGGVMIPTNVHQEEVLRRRYREVLAGFEKFGTMEIIQRYLVDFEEALRDLEICAQCKAKQVVRLGKDDSSPWQQFMVMDCPFGIEPKPWEEQPETHGHVGFYYAIAEESKFSTEPLFRYHNCPGPVVRMKEHAARCMWQGGEPPPEPVPKSTARTIPPIKPIRDPSWTE